MAHYDADGAGAIQPICIGPFILLEAEISSNYSDSTIRNFDIYQFGIEVFCARLVTVISFRDRKGRDYYA